MPTTSLVTSVGHGSVSVEIENRFSNRISGNSIAGPSDEIDVERARQDPAEHASDFRDDALQAVTQGVAITDPTLPDNPIVYASPGFLRLTGYEQGEVLGRNSRFLSGPSTDPLSLSNIRDAIGAGRPLKVVLWNYRKDGTRFWNELAITPVHDAAGGVSRFVCLHSDITQRQHDDEQLRQSQTMEVIGQLAGGIAHDFNNLLTVIMVYSDLLLRSPLENTSDINSLIEISRAGERAASLARQLLALSQNRKLALELININTIVRDLESLLRRVMRDDIEISIALQPDVDQILADRGQFAQVVLNLAVKARDSMTRGGKLVIETRNVAILESAKIAERGVAAGEYAALTVAYTGAGTSYEASRSTSNAGLADDTFAQLVPANDILTTALDSGVAGCNGFLETNREIDGSMTCTVYFRSTGRPADSIPQYLPRRILPRGDAHILLVENDQAVRELGKLILQSCGYTVYDAQDAASALAIAQDDQIPIHLLFTDIVLPGAGGGWLAEQVRIIRPKIRVMFSSGCTYGEMVGHNVDPCQVTLLAKPFSTSELANAVREVLDKD